LTLFANIAVLAGIVFLGLEIQQNTRMIESQTKNSITQNINDIGLAGVENEYTAGVIAKGLRDNIEPGVYQENITWILFAQGNFRNWENEWYQYRNGIFDEEEYEGRRRNMYRNLEFPGFRTYWEDYRQTFSDSFIEQIDLIISETPIRESF